MKRSSLLLTSVLCLSAVSAIAKGKKKDGRINTSKSHLIVRIHNDTDVDLGKVAATFRFYEQQKTFVGEKEVAEKKFIEGMLTTPLEHGKGIDLNSDNALYNGKPAKDFFGKKPYYVVLHKVSAGRWHIPGTPWMLRSARKVFKEGTQHHLKFDVVVTKNRFGFPQYKIKSDEVVTTL